MWCWHGMPHMKLINNHNTSLLVTLTSHHDSCYWFDELISFINQLKILLSFAINNDSVFHVMITVVTPLWAKCEGEAHTPKSGKLESSGTPENSKHDCKGQISSHLSALGVIGKVLKCRCPKWPRMSQLDICSPSYGQKKG